MARPDPPEKPPVPRTNRKSWPWIAALALFIVIMLLTRGWRGPDKGMNDRHIDGTDEPGVAPYNK